MYADFGTFRDTYHGEGMLQFCDGLPLPQADGLAGAPPGLLVRKNYLDPATCEQWRTFLARRPTQPLGVQKVAGQSTGQQPVFTLDQQRVTEHVMAAELEQAFRNVVLSAFQDLVLPYFDHDLHWVSPPSILKYRSGGKYDAHSDNEYWDENNRRWVRSMDRDFSLLLYLNNDFDGGGLYFSNFDLRLQPEPGMLVAFPSDHRFQHAAEPLISGERYVIVSWAAARGIPKLHSFPVEAILP